MTLTREARTVQFRWYRVNVIPCILRGSSQNEHFPRCLVNWIPSEDFAGNYTCSYDGLRQVAAILASKNGIESCWWLNLPKKALIFDSAGKEETTLRRLTFFMPPWVENNLLTHIRKEKRSTWTTVESEKKNDWTILSMFLWRISLNEWGTVGYFQYRV